MAILGVIPKVEEEIIKIAEQTGVSKVIVFGSRARGDYQRTSDVDLAVAGGNAALFAIRVDEETSTLLCFDIVCLDRPVQADLLQSIVQEGKVVYEKI